MGWESGSAIEIGIEKERVVDRKLSSLRDPHAKLLPRVC